MKYLLIIMLSSNGFGGKEALKVPVETLDLCEKGRQSYAEVQVSPEHALRNSFCVKVKE